MKNSVDIFNSLNGKEVKTDYLKKLSTQAFDEQQFEVMERVNALLNKYPEAEIFILEIDTPATFDETAHGGMVKPKKIVQKVKKAVKKQKRNIARKAVNIKTDIKDEAYYVGMGVPYVSNNEANKIGIENFAQLGKAIKTDDVYKMVTDRILSAIDTYGDLTWYNGRNENKGKDAFIKLPLPINYNISKYYRGINAVLLSHYPVKELKDKKANAYEIVLIPITDNRLFWMTFPQIEKAGGKLKKGSVGLEAVYYNFIYKNGSKTITEEQYNELISKHGCKKPSNRNISECKNLKKIPFLRYYKVFNERDIEGIDFDERRKKIDAKAIKFETETEKIQAAESIIKHMPQRPTIIEKHIGKGQSPNYQPLLDRVEMPLKSQYDNVAIWYGTAFHELVHATGHETRLKRKGIIDFDGFGSPQYAFEELVAELGSAFLNAESGILFHTLKKNAAYIKGWKNKVKEILKNDNKAIFKASGQAQKAADFILNKNSKGVPEYIKATKITNVKKSKNKKNDYVWINDEKKGLKKGARGQILEIIKTKNGFDYKVKFENNKIITLTEKEFIGFKAKPKNFNFKIEISTSPKKPKTILGKVKHAEKELKAMKTHTQLRQWAINNGMDNRVAFPKFKKALNEIGLDYDQIKTGISAKETKKLLDSTTKEVTLFSDAKASRDRFGITDKDGNPVWYGRFFDNDRDYNGEQSSGELAAASKAVWLASKIKEAAKVEAIKLNLFVDAQWLTYQNHAKQKGYKLTRMAKKYNVLLEVNWIPGTENPADEYTVTTGYKNWRDNNLMDLVHDIVPNALGRPCGDFSDEENKRLNKAETERVKKAPKSDFSKTMPPEVIKEIKSWDIISKSPYSHSYYNTGCKDWNTTPEGSLRISDHWNFYSRRRYHAETDKKTIKEGWTLAQYKNGKYHVLKEWGFDKDYLEAMKKAEEKAERERKEFIRFEKLKRIEAINIVFETIQEVFKIKPLKKEKKRTLANAKAYATRVLLRKKPMAIMQKGVYEGSGRRTRRVGTTTIKGKIQFFNKNSVTINGITSQSFHFKDKKYDGLHTLTFNPENFFAIKQIKPSKPESNIKKLGTVMIDVSTPTIPAVATIEGGAAVAPLDNQTPPIVTTPKKPKQTQNNKVNSKNNLMDMTFDTITMDEGWENFMQDPAANMKLAIWGKPKNGKTSGALALANYLTKHGSVFYNFVDQGFNKSTQDLWRNSGLATKKNATPSDIDNLDGLVSEIKKEKPRFVFIDMINDYINKNKISPQEFKDKFIKGFPNTSFILVFEVTKGGDFKGDQGWTHIVDAIVTVDSFLMENRGRYGVGHHIIWEEGLKRFNPKKYKELCADELVTGTPKSLPTEVTI